MIYYVRQIFWTQIKNISATNLFLMIKDIQIFNTHAVLCVPFNVILSQGEIF